MAEFAGTPNGTGRRIAVVACRFNESVTRKLADGAIDALVRHGIAARRHRRRLGARARGSSPPPPAGSSRPSATTRSSSSAPSFAARRRTSTTSPARRPAVSRRRAPTTTSRSASGCSRRDTIEQAEARAGGAHGNKGWDAALAALEMADLLRPARCRAGDLRRARGRARFRRCTRGICAMASRSSASPARCGTTSPSRLTSARSPADRAHDRRRGQVDRRRAARRHHQLASRAPRRDRARRAASRGRRAPARRDAAARGDSGSRAARRALREYAERTVRERRARRARAAAWGGL